MAEPLDEIVECWRFWTRDYWFAFKDDARSTSSWREQNHVLIQHLFEHYVRLSSYTWGPSEAWLVAWAISHADLPFQAYLTWSLHLLVPDERDVTIQTFAEHLELWADLFESRRVKYFREAVASDEPSFLYHQHAVGSPWIAHFLLSKPEYWQYTCEMWKTLCRQRLEGKNVTNIQCFGPPSHVCTHNAPTYQAIGPELLKDHLDSREKGDTASGALDYILSRYEKQKNKTRQPAIHESTKPKAPEHEKKKNKGDDKTSPRITKRAQLLQRIANFKPGKKFPTSTKKKSKKSMMIKQSPGQSFRQRLNKTTY